MEILLFNLSHYKTSDIATLCSKTLIYAYLDERNNKWDKIHISITEKRLQMAATLPAGVCEWLQLLPTYFDVTPIVLYLHYLAICNWSVTHGANKLYLLAPHSRWSQADGWSHYMSCNVTYHGGLSGDGN